VIVVQLAKINLKINHRWTRQCVAGVPPVEATAVQMDTDGFSVWIYVYLWFEKL
jgi:hypothetical protein